MIAALRARESGDHRTRHQQCQFARLTDHLARASFAESLRAQPLGTTKRATGQRFPSQEVRGGARVPTLMRSGR